MADSLPHLVARTIARLPRTSLPRWVEAPAIVGQTLAVGDVVNFSAGRVIGFPAPATTTSVHVSGVDRGAAPYTILAADVGKIVTVVGRASNASGTGTASSPAVPVVSGAPGSRLSVSGARILQPNGQEIVLRGVNQSTWGTNAAGDAAAIRGLGANCVRLVLRWWGNYPEANADGRSANPADDYLNPYNLARIKEEISWAVAQGLWVILAFDSDCGQNGLHDVAFCDPLGQYPESGHNFWSDPQVRHFFKTAWQRVAAELLSCPFIACWELLPEPLGGRDDSFADDVRDFYRDVIAAVREVDPRTPFLIGARDAYDIGYAAEARLPERSDVIYTGNLLSPRVINQPTIHTSLDHLCAMRDTHGVPILVQQVGRRSRDDADLTAMNGVLSLLNARGVSYTWWQYKQNTAELGEYALHAKDGAGGWVPKPAELATFGYFMGQSIERLEADAIAAAQAAQATLIYIRADLSNCFTDTAATLRAVPGAAVARINAVAGSGHLLQPNPSLRPTLGAARTPGHHVWVLDGVSQVLQLDSTYFAPGDDTVVIAAGLPAAGAGNRTMFHCGTPQSGPRYPYLGVTGSTDRANASWRGDDAVLRACDGISPCAGRPLVLSAVRIAGVARLFVNGVREGATATGAIGSLAALTRSRAGATAANGGYFQGPMALLCVAKAMSDAQRLAIERFAAYVMGAALRALAPGASS